MNYPPAYTTHVILALPTVHPRYHDCFVYCPVEQKVLDNHGFKQVRVMFTEDYLHQNKGEWIEVRASWLEPVSLWRKKLAAKGATVYLEGDIGESPSPAAVCDCDMTHILRGGAHSCEFVKQKRIRERSRFKTQRLSNGSTSSTARDADGLPS